MFIFRIAIIQGVLRKFSLGLHSFGINVAFIEEKIPVYIWKSSDHSHYWFINYAGVDYTIVQTILDRDSFPLKFYLKGIHTTSCMLLSWLKGQNTGWLLLSSTDLFPQDTWNIYVAFLSPPKSISHLEEIAKVRHRFQLQWLSPNLSEMRWSGGTHIIQCIPYPTTNHISPSLWELNSVLYTFKLGRVTFLAVQGSQGGWKPHKSSLHWEASGLGRAGQSEDWDSEDWARVPYLLSRGRVSMTNFRGQKWHHRR